MKEPKTPNLGLNNIDRSSPSTTYFDLDKYLDQNWEKVDDFAEQVEEKVEETAAQVSGIQERLDTEKRRSVTLEPGLQIINAERASAFKLEGLKGRTLVNLLGRDGGCEDLSKIGVYQSALSLDSSNKVQGQNGLKITISKSTSGIGYFTVALEAGKSYVAIAEVKNGDGSSVYINLAGVGAAGNPVTDTSKFKVTWTRYTAPTDMTLNIDIGVVGTAVGQYGYADAVRLYEIEPSEYTALASMTPEMIAAKYPYVNSIQPVRNPYVIRYGENLLPPFYQATRVTAASKAVAEGTYGVKFEAGSDMDFIAFHIQVIPNSNYTFSYEHEGYSSVTFEGAGWAAFDTSYKSGITAYSYEKVKTFNVGNRSTVAIVIRSFDSTKTVSCKNWMLTLGETSRPFKSQEDAILGLQTDLHADPVTGMNADGVFEKGGQYFKLAKWKKVELADKLTYRFDSAGTGFKIVTLDSDILPKTADQGRVIKYDGTILKPWQAVIDGADFMWFFGNGQNFYLTISNTDSGWGDSYTPTADEIRAYFTGWRMYDGGQTGNPYNNVGTKTWNSIKHWGTPPYYTTTLPKNQAPDWNPYQLFYKLATTTVEPIISEGQLTLFEGSNQVEVATGIVLREPAKPIKFDNYDINIGKIMGNSTLYEVGKWIALYENGHLKPNGWGVFEGQDNGKEIGIYAHRYNPAAAYSVTYLMKDAFPAASFVGSISENEKSLLTDLTNIVHQNTASISMLEISAADGGMIKNYVDNKPWQKYKITQDNGSVLQLPHNSNLNDIKTGGQYDCFNAVNVPGGVTNAWFYIEVLVHSNAPTHVIQRASRLDTHNIPTLFMRTCMDNIWSAWSSDVFQSGVNAKNGIVDAINAIGGSASTSDTWAQLANEINTIQIGQPQKLMPNIDFSQEFTDTTRLFYLDIATFPPGTKLIQLNRIGGGDSSVVLGSGGTSGTASTVVLIDSNNLEWAVSSTHPTYMRTFLHITIDVQRGTSNFLDTPATGDVTYNMPAGFNVKGLLKLKYKFTKGYGYATFYGRYKLGATIISL